MGGIAGRVIGADSSIAGCQNIGKVSGAGDTGGIVGQVNTDGSSILKCSNQAEITLLDGTISSSTKAKAAVGAVAGTFNSENGVVEMCGNTCSVTDATENTAASYAGGLVGRIDHGELSESFSTGEICANGKVSIGGTVGYAAVSTIESCYNTGDITVTDPTATETDDEYTGGMIGFATKDAGLKDSYTAGKVTVADSGDKYTGAMIGRIPNGTAVSNNYALQYEDYGDEFPLIVSTASSFVPSDANARFLTDEELKSAETASALGELFAASKDDYPKLLWEHQWEVDSITKATPSENGTIVYKCSVSGCDAERSETIYCPKTFTLSATSYTYNGSAKAPSVKIADAAGSDIAAENYKVTYANNTKAGTATVTVTFEGDYYSGTKNLTFTIAKATNPLKVGGKTATLKFKTLKKKNQALTRTKVLTVSKNQGSVTYTKYSGNNKITINKKTGKVTVKKKIKKGTYSVKVKVTAAGNTNYKPLTKTVTFKVKVK